MLISRRFLKSFVETDALGAMGPGIPVLFTAWSIRPKFKETVSTALTVEFASAASYSIGKTSIFG